MSHVVAILSAALVLSLVHSLLPNHWLPFVLMGRVQGWNERKMVKILCAAGAAHMAVAGAIAMVVLLIGAVLAPEIAHIGHLLPGIILFVAGVFYIWLDLMRPKHNHHHHEVHEAAEKGMSDKTAIVTLILTLALSPCEAMVPVFVAAAPSGDPVLLLAMVVMSSFVSLAVMTVLAVLAWRGIARFGFGRLAKWERLVIGSILTAIGGVMFVTGVT